MTLASHIRRNDWSQLEDAWTELLLGSAEVKPALEAIRAAKAHKNVARCLPFVKDHAQALAEQGKPAEAAELLGRTMLAGGSPGELGDALFENAEKAWGKEPFWEAFSEIAGLRAGAPDMRSAWSSFSKLLSLEVGRVIYHAKGWGLGRITSIDHGELEIKVDFISGKRDRFPFASAIDIFEVLEDDDLRALVVTDPERLKKLLKEEPLEVLRWVLRRAGGKATHAGIKLTMTTLGLEGARFTAWWRRAKKQAETSEWFELSGPSARGQVRLLDRAEDPAEGLRRQLMRSKSLTDALARVRALFAGDAIADDVRAAALESLRELAEGPGEALPAKLAVWLFLREETGETPPELAAELERVAAEPEPTDPSQPPALWALFHQVPGQREQERCLELLRGLYGDDWLDAASRNLPHAAPGMARALVLELHDAGRDDVLVEHYSNLLARASRRPLLLVALAEGVEKRELEGHLPSPEQRAQCLLQLAVYLYRNSPGQPLLTRARARLNALLAEGERPLLRRLLEKADRASLRSLAKLVEGGVDVTLDRVFTRTAVQLFPDIFRGDERPFWTTGAIWTTRAGLARHEEELRLLREVKIPENSEAIGRAASYGDLSENSEWEAAIEEQRNLTTRAMTIEEELRNAQLIENASVPEDTVCPGTRVRYRDAEGHEAQVTILGPWDGGEEGVISYRSPLAQGMLGNHPGDRVQVELPTGPTEVEILAVEPVHFT